MSKTDNYNLDKPHVDQDIKMETIPNLASNFEVIDNELIKKAQIQKNTLTVNIPSDYLTLQDAVDKLSELKVINRKIIILNIESNHQLKEGLLVENGNFSHFKITSTDAVVYLDTNFSGASDEELPETGDVVDDNVIMGINARMPVLACVIDMQNDFGHGYYGAFGCDGFVEKNCGVINAGHSGLHFRAGKCSGAQTVWNGANEAGIRVTHGAVVSVQSAQVNNCQKTPHAEEGAVDVSRGSIVHFQKGEAKNSGSHGGTARRSFFNADSADFSDANRIGFRISSGSTGIAPNVNATNCGEHGMYAFRGGKIVASRSNVNGASGHGFFAVEGAEIDCFEATANNVGLRSVMADQGSRITADEMTATNSGEGGVRSQKGSHVSCSNADFSGSQTGYDMSIWGNGIIYSGGATGTRSHTVNTISSAGIIFE